MGGSESLIIAVGADLWNHVLTGDVTMALTSARMDPHHNPCVVIAKAEKEE